MADTLIDANIILGFWKLRDGRTPTELLQFLIDIKARVLVTQQLVDEVNRNKLRAFLEHSEVPKFEIPARYPAALLTGADVDDTNGNIDAFERAGSALKKGVDLARQRIALRIASNSDQISIFLRPLLNSPAHPTREQLEAARDRRERGNPPGKRSDTLGDQIVWQQFLDALGKQQTVRIVTRDGDYTDMIGKKRVLKPFLQAELTERGVVNAEVFETLSAAVSAFKLAGVDAGQDLDGKRLEQLEEEEDEAFSPIPPYLIWPDGRWRCPSCSKVNNDTPLIPRPSRYGGWSYWTNCGHCGCPIDTGEGYDG